MIPEHGTAAAHRSISGQIKFWEQISHALVWDSNYNLLNPYNHLNYFNEQMENLDKTTFLILR